MGAAHSLFIENVMNQRSVTSKTVGLTSFRPPENDEYLGADVVGSKKEGQVTAAEANGRNPSRSMAGWQLLSRNGRINGGK